MKLLLQSEARKISNEQIAKNRQYLVNFFSRIKIKKYHFVEENTNDIPSNSR